MKRGRRGKKQAGRALPYEADRIGPVRSSPDALIEDQKKKKRKY